MLARDPARSGELALRVEAVVGDLGEADYVGEALAGADAAYVGLPEDFTAPDPLAAVLACAESVVAGVRAAGVPRVVLQSSGGAELREGAGLVDGLGHAEAPLDAYAADSGANVLHLRCGFLMTNLLTSAAEVAGGGLSVVGDPEVPMVWVDPADIAGVAAVNLLSRQGPVDVCRGCTAADRRAQLTDIGMSPLAAEQVVAMIAGLRGHVPEPARSPASTTPSTLAGWAHTVLRPAVDAVTQG